MCVRECVCERERERQRERVCVSVCMHVSVSVLVYENMLGDGCYRVGSFRNVFHHRNDCL